MGWGWRTLFVAFAICVIVLPSVLHIYASSYPETELLGFTFRFDGTEYNPATDESTWYYTVTGPMVPGPRYKDLSHWIIALCTPHTVTAASGAWERMRRPDPHHGIIGLKWDDEVSKTGSRTFSFSVKGNWTISETVQIGAKAGPETAQGVLPGPSCEVDICELNYFLTTQSNWRFLKPGVYAAPAMYIQFAGKSAARLSFSDFRDAEYVADWSMSPNIVVEYSLGATLADAEAFGWHTAHQFNDLEVVIPQHAVQAGAQVNVWMRIHVTDVHRSSDYLGGGRVTIDVVCD